MALTGGIEKSPSPRLLMPWMVNSYSEGVEKSLSDLYIGSV